MHASHIQRGFRMSQCHTYPDAGVTQAQAATKLLFDTDLTDIRPEDVVEALRYDPRYHAVQETELLGMPLTKLAVSSGLTKTRGKTLCSPLLLPTYVTVASRSRPLSRVSRIIPEQCSRGQSRAKTPNTGSYLRSAGHPTCRQGQTCCT